MAGTAAVVTAITAAAGAGTAVYQANQAAKDRDDAKDRLREQRNREAAILEDEADKLKSKQRAAYAASGVVVDQDSPLAVIEQSQKDAAEQRDAVLKGYDYKASDLSKEASRARTSGYATAAGTLLTGVGDYAANPYTTNPFT